MLQSAHILMSILPLLTLLRISLHVTKTKSVKSLKFLILSAI